MNLLQTCGTLSPGEAEHLLARLGFDSLRDRAAEITREFNAELATPGSHARAVSDEHGTVSRSRIFSLWVLDHTLVRADREERNREQLILWSETIGQRKQAMREGAVYNLTRNYCMFRCFWRYQDQEHAISPDAHPLPDCIRLVIQHAAVRGFEWILLENLLVNVPAVVTTDGRRHSAGGQELPTPQAGCTVETLADRLRRVPLRCEVEELLARIETDGAELAIQEWLAAVADTGGWE